MTTATRSRRNTVSAPAPRRAITDDDKELLSDFAQRVLHRLEAAPRFQSIGRNKYVYVGDVKQAIDREMYGGAE